MIAYVKIQNKMRIYYPLCYGFWSSGESSTRAFQGDEWVTPDVGNRRQEKILHAAVNYKRYWVTFKNSSECQRLIANMKKHAQKSHSGIVDVVQFP